MEKYGIKLVPIAHADDKRQTTAILAASATGKYLLPSSFTKARLLLDVTHMLSFLKAGTHGIPRTGGQMKRQ